MGYKVFQDFAHVMCQKFIEVPSNGDLINLAVLGNGLLELDVLAQKATHNRHAIKPLPFSDDWLAWVNARMIEKHISLSEMTGAILSVEFTVDLYRKDSLGWLCARFSFDCTARIDAPGRSYSAAMVAERDWGLSCV